jgi:hypothetical protein
VPLFLFIFREWYVLEWRDLQHAVCLFVGCLLSAGWHSAASTYPRYYSRNNTWHHAGDDPWYNTRNDTGYHPWHDSRYHARYDSWNNPWYHARNNSRHYSHAQFFESFFWRSEFRTLLCGKFGTVFRRKLYSFFGRQLRCFL